MKSTAKTEWLHLDEVTSTQDEVRSRLSAAVTGTLASVFDKDAARPWRVALGISARHQTAGRGRLQRTWVDAPGNMLVSIGFVDDLSDKEFPVRVNRAAAAALLDVIDGLLSDSPAETVIKWPNDILVDGRKLAGILVETLNLGGNLRGTVLGVGANVASSPKGAPGAVALNELRPDVTVDGLLKRFLANLDDMLHDHSRALERYEEKLTMPERVRTPRGEGKPVSYRRGVVTLETASGRVELNEADIITWEG